LYFGGSGGTVISEVSATGAAQAVGDLAGIDPIVLLFPPVPARIATCWCAR